MTEALLDEVTPIDRAARLQFDYLGEVIRLRLTQQLNSIDGDLTFDRTTREPTGKQITYVVDSNVFYFYINTLREHHLADALPGLRRRSHMRNGEAAGGGDPDIAPAVITAEYIFSGRLPGQMGFPVYIDKEHADEFQGKVSRLIREISQTRVHQSDEEKARLKRRTDALVRDLTRPGVTVAQLRKIFDRRLPRLIEDFRLEQVDQAVHLLHLMEDDVARPLRLAPGINGDILNRQPDADLVAAWFQRMETYMPAEIQHDRAATDTRTRNRNRRRDAIALARFETLNEDCRARGMPNRYVLITTSQTMLSAGAYWLHETGRPLSDSFVRPLTQFVPILNFRDMPNFVDRETAAESLRMAMDGLFQWSESRDDEGWVRFLMRLDIHVRSTNRLHANVDRPEVWGKASDRERAVMRTIAEDSIRQALRGVDLDRFDRNLDGITSLWDDLMANAVGLNSRLLTDHYRTHLGRVSECVTSMMADDELSGELSASYETRHMSLAARLARVHLRMAARLMMTNPTRQTERFAQTVRGARVSLYLSEARGRQVMSIVDLIAEGRHSEAEAQLVALSEDRGLDVAQLNLAIATIALRMGLWENAENFARQAASFSRRQGSDGTLINGEALWLMAVARRIAIASKPAEQDGWDRYARHGLAESWRHQTIALEVFTKAADLLGRARSRAELALVKATGLLLDIEQGVAVTEARGAVALSLAFDALGDARVACAPPTDASDEDPIAVRTRLIAGMSMTQVLLVAHIAGLDSRSAEHVDLAGMLNQIETDMAKLNGGQFDAWPLLINLLRALAGLPGAGDVHALSTACKAVGARIHDASTIANDLEYTLACKALEQLTARRG